MSVPNNMSNLAVSTITKALTKQFIIKLMKITQFRKNEDTIALSVMDLDILVNKIKTEIKSRPVSTFREHLRYTLSDERCMFADKLPKIIPAAEFRKVNGQKQMKNYNGIVELTIGPLSNKSEIALVKQKACEQPQTRCVFMGSSGKTVKIWTTFTRPDNSLPNTRELNHYGESYPDVEKLSEQWRAYDIFPMASNVQFVFFHKKGSNDVLVKVLLNEKETKLPVKTDVAPYYHWKDVESYYREKLDKYQHI